MVVLAVPRARAADYLELTKPGIVGLVLMTVAAGFYLGADAIAGLTLFHTLLGAALVAAGSNALNQVAERDYDARMARTRNRPLPAGRLAPAEALVFAWAAGLGGITYLAVLVNPLTAALAAATLVSYVFLYTPLKRVTSLNTLVGAVPGALPIVGGWTAACGTVDLVAVALFALMYLWQLPHFLSLAWMLKGEYAAAGYKMLSVTDPDGAATFRHAFLFAAALLPVSLVPSVVGATGGLYFFGSVGCAIWLLWATVAAARERTYGRARRLFVVSVAYLPVLLGFMVVDKVL